jgi:hypothetical protein
VVVAVVEQEQIQEALVAVVQEAIVLLLLNHLALELPIQLLLEQEATAVQVLASMVLLAQILFFLLLLLMAGVVAVLIRMLD